MPAPIELISASVSCGWPFHNDPNCAECRDWVDLYDKSYAAFVDESRARRSRKTKTAATQPDLFTVTAENHDS